MQVSLLFRLKIQEFLFKLLRIRRVKCDEQKPECKRCTSTGRTCEGYMALNPGSQPSKAQVGSNTESRDTLPCHISLHSPLFNHSQGGKELRSFKYFQSRINSISGHFESDFWGRLVLQASHTIRHAVLALSSVYEVHEFGQQGLEAPVYDSNGVLMNRDALGQYTKAVTILSQSLSQKQTSIQVALVNCLLFIWLEFLRNDFKTSLKHLKSGLKIIKDAKSQPGLWSEIDASISPLFERLKAQIALHGCPNSDFHSGALVEFIGKIDLTSYSSRLKTITFTNDNKAIVCMDSINLKLLDNNYMIPTSFYNIFDARSYLDKELSAIYVFIRQQQELVCFWGRNKHPEPAQFPIVDTRKLHLQRLEKWFDAFKNSTLAGEFEQGSKKGSSILLAQIDHAYITLILQTLFPNSEMLYDEYMSQFTHLISLIENLHLMSIPPKSSYSKNSSTLSFEQGIIIPLFFIILKCRHLPLRQRALELLRRAPEREGMWHRDSLLRGAETKVHVEELGRIGEGLEGLPESARATRERVIDIGDGKVKICFRRSGAGDAEIDIEVDNVISKFGALL
jgi:hypothetical protein